MLEPVARSGPARRLAWRRGDHTVLTPLLVARSDLRAPADAARLLTGNEDATPFKGQAVIRIAGGFLRDKAADGPSDAPAEGDGAWATLGFATQEAIQVRLGRLQRPTRVPALPELRSTVRDEDHADASEERSDVPVSPLRGAAGMQTVQLTAVQRVDPGPRSGQDPGEQDAAAGLIMTQEVAVAAGLVGDVGDPQRFASRLVQARRAAGATRLLMVPGVGLVHHVALLVYAGVDLLDTLAVERATAAGWYLTSEGAYEATRLRAPLCGCEACRESAPSRMGREALSAHNLHAFDEERTRVIGHLESDTLRGLVEQRARAHPKTAAVLRQLDRHLDHFAARWPLNADSMVHATCLESLSRPDVARYRARLREDYRPPELADVLLLLPCSAKKPYARSSSHRVFRRVIADLGAASRVHEVMLTSPMGVVPRELENTWPAAHYDVPVTGHWDREELHMIRHQLGALLAKGSYSRVVSHLDEETHARVADLLPEGTPHTGAPHPTSIPARDTLRRALQDATRGAPAPVWPKRRRSDAHAVLRWQVGPEAAGVLIGATEDVSGRPPGMRIYAGRGNRDPLATFVPRRGLFAFTLRAARLLHEAGCARTVEIDDFTPRGTLFAVGVQGADPRIVPGDEVVLVHDGAVRGVGRACMTGEEMTGFPRGAAVEVRHHA